MTEQQLRKREYNQRYYTENRERLVAEQRERYAANATKYVANSREYRRRWRLENKSRVRKVNQAWYAQLKADPEAWARHQALCRSWREANPSKMLEYGRKWAKANKPQRRLKHRLYRAKRGGAAGHTTLAQWLARYDYYGKCCAYCGNPVTLAECTRDHVKAVKAGGSNWPANLVPACRSCNSRKRHTYWVPRPVWMRRLRWHIA